MDACPRCPKLLKKIAGQAHALREYNFSPLKLKIDELNGRIEALSRIGNKMARERHQLQQAILRLEEELAGYRAAMKGDAP